MKSRLNALFLFTPARPTPITDIRHTVTPSAEGLARRALLSLLKILLLVADVSHFFLLNVKRNSRKPHFRLRCAAAAHETTMIIPAGPAFALIDTARTRSGRSQGIYQPGTARNDLTYRLVDTRYTRAVKSEPLPYATVETESRLGHPETYQGDAEMPCTTHARHIGSMGAYEAHASPTLPVSVQQKTHRGHQARPTHRAVDGRTVQRASATPPPASFLPCPGRPLYAASAPCCAAATLVQCSCVYFLAGMRPFSLL